MSSRNLGRRAAGRRTIHVHERATCLLLATCLLGLATPVSAGPFLDPGYPIGAMVDWATAVDEVVRGPIDIAEPGLGLASFGSEAHLVGAATASPTDTLSLGDGGWATLYFESGIGNGLDDDFAVFENGFSDLVGFFGELAYVEVASNGIDFVRFDPDALNPFPVPSFDYLDPSEYHGLAGRHETGLGTGFDLEDLRHEPLVLSGDVDLMDIRYVRVVDVIGDGSTFDGAGRPIHDPYPTPFTAGGFDLAAIGVIHAPGAVPEPAITLGLAAGVLGLAFVRRRQMRHALAASMRSTSRIPLAVLASLCFSSPAAALLASFDDLGLGPEAFLNGSSLAGGYTSGGVFFENDYSASFDSFSGFAASTKTDTTTPGFTNQFSNITGSGADGSAGFGLFFLSGSLVLPSEQIVLGADFTNTTYAALSMRDGDSFAKQYGGASGDDPDFFSLQVEGIDDLGDLTGNVEILLADYRFADNTLDYLLDEWVFVDLSSLGAVRELRFSFASSDVGPFGINTPQYFAIDNLVTMPEPGTALLLGLGLIGLARRARVGR